MKKSKLSELQQMYVLGATKIMNKINDMKIVLRIRQELFNEAKEKEDDDFTSMNLEIVKNSIEMEGC